MWNSLMVCGLRKSLGRGTPSLSKLRIEPAIDYDLPPAGKTSAHPVGVLTAPIWLLRCDLRALLMECSSC